MPLGSGEVVVIARAAELIVMAKVRLAVTDALSVTVAVKLKLPAVEGAPVIDPSLPRDNPAGAEPDQ